MIQTPESRRLSPGSSRRILTMFSQLALLLVSPLTLTFASAVQDAGGQTIQPSPVNISNDVPGLRLNMSNDLRVQCDGEKYGFNPIVTDCQNARSFYKRSSQLFTYGERHSGHGINVFPLPYRLMGGRLPEAPQSPKASLYSDQFAETHGR